MTPPPPDPKLPPVAINLMSDTQTRPTQGMREAMARADVGDEQIGDDPTTLALCARVADLLGKDAAVFLPSGTMCNLAATLVHCRPGDEILAHPSAHVLTREGGAHAALGGFQITPLPGENGIFSPRHSARRSSPPRAILPRSASSPWSKRRISAAAPSGRSRTSTPSQRLRASTASSRIWMARG